MRYGGGSRKGIKNKRTRQWEIFSNYCLEGGLEKFERELDSLNGKDFVNAFLTLLEFHRPKLQRSEVVQENSGQLNINIIRHPIGSNGSPKAVAPDTAAGQGSTGAV